MDNIVERSGYLDSVSKLLSKPGDKVNINGYLVNKEDVDELTRLLTVENILFNKKLYIENTNGFKEKILDRLNGLENSDAIIEIEALKILLDIISETPKTKIDDLVVYKKVLVPKKDIDRYIENLNKTILGRAKPLRDASKEDLEDLTLDVTLSQNQHKRINEFIAAKDSRIESFIEDIDDSLDSLKTAKEDAIEMLNNDLVDDYETYLNTCLFDSGESDNQVAVLYYEEMLNRYKEKRVVEELGYLYTQKKHFN